MREMAETRKPKAGRAWDKLCPRHKAFLTAYFGDFNGCLSWQRTMPKGKTCTAEAAIVSASRVLASANVRAALAEQMDLMGMTPERIKAHHAAIIEADLADLEDVVEGGERLSEARRRGIDTKVVRRIKGKRRITRDKDGNETVEVEREIEQYDRQKSLEGMARILKLIGGGEDGAGTTIDLTIVVPPTAEGSDAR